MLIRLEPGQLSRVMIKMPSSIWPWRWGIEAEPCACTRASCWWRLAVRL